MQVCSIAVDLGKTIFHPVALGTAGEMLVKKKCTQKQLSAYTAQCVTTEQSGQDNPGIPARHSLASRAARSPS